MTATGKVQKIFPIKSATACKLKWSWTALYLNWGMSATCHRTTHTKLTPENFNNFHNHPEVIKDREVMLKGEWPEDNCSYCRRIEEAGGASDRTRFLTGPDWYPNELDTNPTAVVVDPVMLEVYFNNTCNLGCLYCGPHLSSVIENEDRKFGTLENHNQLSLDVNSKEYKNLIAKFWEWFPENFSKLKRLHILGGEPFYQKDFDQLLDYIEEYPNPNCELNIVSNLMVQPEKFKLYIERLKKIVAKRKLKRLDISASIDCWGPEQEHVRWGLDLDIWEKNFNFLIENRWIYLNINQTVSALTIKTMPELLTKLQAWRTDRKIGQWFSGVTPDPSFLKAEIFGRQEFVDSAEEILKLMPQDTDENKLAHEYMSGILNQALQKEEADYSEIKKLLIFLDEKDRRRGTNWELVFPWLIKYRKICGIVA